MYEIIYSIFEIIGIVAFAVSGAVVALKKQMDVLGVTVLGMFTAVGGGVLRDVLTGESPYIFVKHFYACASIAGALICAILWHTTGSTISIIIGSATVVVLRLFAAHYRWSLPH